MAAALPPGFYGKLFTVGDFVERRLPREFVEVWDGWLQAAMVASREQLGGAWLDAYMTSPIWRFGISPGLCGNGAWAGVLMPSIDKVGRHYPLILAAPVADAEELPHLFGTAEGAAWFADLEHLALSCLNDGFDMDAFDQSLQCRRPPRFAPTSLVSGMPGIGAGKFARHVVMQGLEQVSAAFLDVSAALMRRFMPTYSLWSSSSERVGASLLVMEGLPPIDAYADLLTGRWHQRGCSMETAPVRLAQTVPASEPLFSPPPPLGENPQPQAGKQPEPIFDADPVTRPRRQRAEAPPWRSWGLSVVGMKRKINEDALLERAADGLWAVADGMGGHQAGDVASQTVVAALAGVVPSADAGEFAERVAQSLRGANSQLFRLAAERGGEGNVIGSTAVVLLAASDRCVFLWAGDKRLYRFREGRLEQLTQDHSLFEDFAAKGLLTPVQLAESGRCDILTRAVGAAETLALDRNECDARTGDLFLLCSDGLDKELAQEEIEGILREKAREEIAKALIEQAENRGARDNVTVVVVEAACGKDGEVKSP